MPRRRLDWLSAVSGVATIAVAPSSATAVYIVLPSYVRDNLQDPTVVRIRGQLLIASGAAIHVGAVGIIPWADVNDTVPTLAEMPLPYGRPSMDWMWWSFFGTATTGDLLRAEWSYGADGADIDTKAMRRLGNDKGLLLVVENGNASLGLNFAFGLRILVKE